MDTSMFYSYDLKYRCFLLTPYFLFCSSNKLDIVLARN